MPGQAGHGREMIEIDRDRSLRARRHHDFDISDQPVVGYALIVKWRQDQRAAEAEIGRVAGERNSIGDGSSAGANHQAVPWNESRPGISGIRGSLNEPVPSTRKRAANAPWSVSTIHR